MNRGKKLLVGLCLAAVIAGGMKIASEYAPKSVRYKITVLVDTPEGPRSGSSVLEFTTTKNLIALPESHSVSQTMRGEAVIVELPGNQTLFALLRQDGTRDIGELIGRTLYPDGRQRAVERTAGDLPVQMNRWLVIGGRHLNEPGIPMLVRFRDINDPKTVEKVDPGNLEASFGPDMKLKAITVQVTTEPVMHRIAQRLPWIADVYKHLGTDFAPEGIPVGDFQELFKTGIRQ